MSLYWSGFLNYSTPETKDGKNTELPGPGLPATQFSVDGGKKKVLDLSSADDISPVAELDQAQHRKNLVLSFRLQGVLEPLT